MGDGAAALDDAAAYEVRQNGPRQPHGVEPEMAEESPVLGGENGLDQGLGHLAGLDGTAVEIAVGGDDFARAVEKGDTGPPCGRRQLLDIGQVEGIPAGDPAQCDAAPDDRQCRQFDERTKQGALFL